MLENVFMLVLNPTQKTIKKTHKKIKVNKNIKKI